MKTILLLLFCCLTMHLNAQTVETQNPDVFPKMESCEASDGSKNGFLSCIVRFFGERIENRTNTSGRAFIYFKINEQGEFITQRIAAPNAVLEQEINEVLKEMPKFVPAYKGEEPIVVNYILPLTFQKQQEEIFVEHPDVPALWQKNDKKEDLVSGARNFLIDRLSKQETEGFIKATLVVNSQGNAYLEDILVQKNEDLSIGNELIKIAQTFPQLIPAKKGGVAVGSKTDLYINLKKIDGIPISKLDITSFPQFKGVRKVPTTIEEFKKSIDAYIIRNFQYPQQAVKERIQGKVFVTFVIDEDGKIHIFDVRGVDNYYLRAEAYRLINNLPIKNPAKEERGNSVSSCFVYPINFKLSY